MFDTIEQCTAGWLLERYDDGEVIPVYVDFRLSRNDTALPDIEDVSAKDQSGKWIRMTPAEERAFVEWARRYYA